MHARYLVIDGKIVGQYTDNWKSPYFTIIVVGYVNSILTRVKSIVT